MPIRSILITGAAQGIGRAIVLRCLKDGFQVLACDNNEKKLTELQHELNSERISLHKVDVSQPNDVINFFRSLKSQKISLYGLVNNAGIYLGKNLFDYSLEEIDEVLNVNLKGAIYFCQQFGKLMVSEKRKGAIVQISSIAAYSGSSDALYGASKAALLGLTKSCALTFAPYVRVNAVAPTLVDTDLIKVVPKKRLVEFRNQELIKDPVQPEDVANSVSFLLSDESSHFTGTVLDINNGFYLR